MTAEAARVDNLFNGSSGPTLDSDQSAAVETAMKEKIMILTGGPGTGKTFTVNSILKTFNLDPSRVALAAPTGKAARRMTEATGWDACTIHRLLEYSPTGGGFGRNKYTPLTADLVIVDESSMLDSWLASCLLSAIKPEARLILVGDKDQLPSVGPGNVLRDLIKSKTIPVAELTHIHRQSEHSWIALNAQRVNRGKSIIPVDPLSEDFFVEFRETAEEVQAAIVKLICETIPAKHGLDPFTDIQLLTPQRQRNLPLTANTLNPLLQNRLNPGDDNQYRGFRPKDKVLHTRNNYELGVFNGETGTILDVHRAGADSYVTVDYVDRKVDYRGTDIDDLTLAYAMTVHKSQGSEWPCIVLPIHSQNSHMLNRNLFYTGLTRAKKLVYVVANHTGLGRAIKNSDAAERQTLLADLLAGNKKEAA